MQPTPLESLDQFTTVLRGRRIAVLTGAGCSTESGIPDYRGEGTRARARNPIQHREFIGSAATRARYWSRAAVGWTHFHAAQPNAAHHAITELEAKKLATGVITQNVDRLHELAGTKRLILLHGSLFAVVCLDCRARLPRSEVQAMLLALNPGFDPTAVKLRPDGDADVREAMLADFRIPTCPHCDGVLKPDVVFFGGSVPRDVVDAAFAILEEADALLIVGSSLAVYSGFRFVRRALERQMPIALVNRGTSRADEHAAVRTEELAGTFLPALVRRLDLPLVL